MHFVFLFLLLLHTGSISLFQVHLSHSLFLSLSVAFRYCFLTTQCSLIPLRISNFSTFSPAFLQHFITTSLVGTRTSPCPHIFARGISSVFISHTNTLLSLVTSRKINLPFGRRHLFTLSKNACPDIFLLIKKSLEPDHILHPVIL